MKAIRFICPECGEVFTVTHHRQQFCTPAHSKAYNNRQLKRGQALVGLGQAWRLARNRKDDESRSLGREAFGEFCRLLDEFSAEDRAAGRLDSLRVYKRRSAAGLLD